MKSWLIAPLIAAASLAAIAAVAQTAPVQAALKGYLAAGAAPDALRILPPPPAPGSKREQGDREAFAQTRDLAGTARWILATQDANLSQGADLYSCALGVTLDGAKTPTLVTVFRRAGLDAIAATDPAKTRYGRARPYSDPSAADAAVCVEKTDSLTKNPSYPSGHASISWTWGLILAELAPDRATEILGRARSIGESRVVCGVHFPSDVEAGRMTSTAVVAALHGDAAFRADMERARGELAALRAGPHATPPECSTQNQASEHAPY